MIAKVMSGSPPPFFLAFAFPSAVFAVERSVHRRLARLTTPPSFLHRNVLTSVSGMADDRAASASSRDPVGCRNDFIGRLNSQYPPVHLLSFCRTVTFESGLYNCTTNSFGTPISGNLGGPPSRCRLISSAEREGVDKVGVTTTCAKMMSVLYASETAMP